MTKREKRDLGLLDPVRKRKAQARKNRLIAMSIALVVTILPIVANLLLGDNYGWVLWLIFCVLFVLPLASMVNEDCGNVTAGTGCSTCGYSGYVDVSDGYGWTVEPCRSCGGHY